MLFLEQLAQLGSRGRLARTLQADHHDHHRRLGREIEFAVGGIGILASAEHRHQLVIDDLDDLLTRRDRAQHVLAHRFLGHRIDKAADHGQRDIGFEQRHANLAHGFAHVAFGQRAAPLQAVEDVTEAIGQIVEHACLLLPNRGRPE